LLAKVERLLTQQRYDKNTLSSLHALEVECISKRKARQPYEFGASVSVPTTHKEGLVIGMRSIPGNTSDGPTLLDALEQAAMLTGSQPKEAFVDLGYRGVELQKETAPYHRKLKRDITARLRRDIRQRHRARDWAHENDGRLRRNRFKGADGDS
jgi:IS5 family transposase